jgi:hypothetical protein
MKQPKILFFTAGAMPTIQDRTEAADIGVVHFRNARKINPDERIEECDGVAGPAIPPQYRNAYPNADNAIKNHRAALKELAKQVGGELPPQLPHGGKTETENAAAIQQQTDAKAGANAGATGPAKSWGS